MSLKNLRILFVHQNFPGQYLHIARELAAQGGHQLVSLSIEKPEYEIEGVIQVRYGINRGNQKGLHPWLTDLETKVIRGECCARAANTLKEKGFHPNIICGHPGWGEMLFLKEIWPDVPILAYQEFYYHAYGYDFDFDKELQKEPSWEDAAKVRLKTANALIHSQAIDWSVTPTCFQKSTFPGFIRERTSVIHDGIDTELATPRKKDESISVEVGDGVIVNERDKIVSFVNRRLEPYRGCHTMIRAIPFIQERCPDAKIVLVGRQEGVSYGSPCEEGEWKDRFLSEIKGSYNPDNVFFTGPLEYADYMSLMKITSAHIYLTYPFVLSWSMLEAMSCEAPIIGSQTPPVSEVIIDGQNGLLTDFFDSKMLADKVEILLKDKSLAISLGKAARQKVLEKYSLSRCLPQQLALISLLASGALP
jgi:glycosyltransferase involved in cell wall biosynthesis